jgi:hypothetical protein
MYSGSCSGVKPVITGPNKEERGEGDERDEEGEGDEGGEKDEGDEGFVVICLFKFKDSKFKVACCYCLLKTAYCY